MTKSKDLYQVLGVSRGASQDEIRKVYRKLARKLHPDVNPGDAAAETRFKEISAAYSVLSDEEKRKLYDEFGDVALQVGFDADKARRYRSMGGGVPFDFSDWSSEAFSNFSGSGGFEDLLGSIFGGRFRSQGGAPRRGAHLRAHLAVDLPTAVQGGTHTISVGGRQVDVKLPAGVRDGQQLRLSGLGQPGPGGAGNLYVKIRLVDHPCYRRHGDDLHLDVPITVLEAVAGGKVDIPTPKGQVTITVPPGSQSGRKLRLKGLGVGGGNLYAHLEVMVPDGDGAAVEELARQLQEHYPDDVRKGLRF
jgi:DnaJ-class molecular chaperone